MKQKIGNEVILIGLGFKLGLVPIFQFPISRAHSL